MKKINEFFQSKTDNLTFIELKSDKNININGYILNSKIPMPILVDELINEIKERRAQESINFNSFVNGMIYSIGSAYDFKFNKDYIEILKAFSDKIEDYILINGIKFIEENNLDKGLVYLRALTNINRNNKLGLFNYGLGLEKKAQEFYKLNKEKEGNLFIKEATACFEDVLSLDENFGPAYYKLGYHYLNSNQYLKSKFMWDKFLNITDDDNLKLEINENLIKINDNVIYEEGCNEIFSGNPNLGLDKLLPLKEKYNKWWNLLFMIGLSYRQLGKYEEAIKEFKKVLEIAPNQVDTLNELGLCYANTGSYEMALEKFSTAIDLKEDYEIICNRGMTYLQLGNIDKAKLDIERAYELNPEDSITKMCMKQIKSIIS